MSSHYAQWAKEELQASLESIDISPQIEIDDNDGSDLVIRISDTNAMALHQLIDGYKRLRESVDKFRAETEPR